jgi:hypothetical protein
MADFEAVFSYAIRKSIPHHCHFSHAFHPHRTFFKPFISNFFACVQLQKKYFMKIKLLRRDFSDTFFSYSWKKVIISNNNKN